DEERFVTAYRAAGRSNVRSLPRRAVGRLGAGGTAVVVTVALTSGVAAAYTRHLPDPVQRFAHTLIAVIPPAAPGRQHPAASVTPSVIAPSSSPTGAASPGRTGAPSSAPGSSATSGPATPGSTQAAGGHPGHHGTGASQGTAGVPTGGPTTGT